jgi:hypothetical protein
MLLGVTGAPARKLLQTLKEQVKPDKGLKEMGLTMYISKDGLLECEETDSAKPFCTISFNPSQLKIEPVPICE